MMNKFFGICVGCLVVSSVGVRKVLDHSSKGECQHAIEELFDGNAMPNLWHSLGLRNHASFADCRAAYRRLAKIHHPDRPNGDQIIFQAITTANDWLGDKDCTALYEKYLKVYRLATPPAADPEPKMSEPDATEKPQYPVGPQYEKGTRVDVFGLKTQTKLNGVEAIVTKADLGSGRWELKLDNGKVITVKPENVREQAAQAPRARPRAQPRQDKPHPEPAAEPAASKATLPDTFVAGDGCIVYGLTKHPEVNGKQGVLISRTPINGRLLVKLNFGKVVELKPENLIPLKTKGP